MADIQTLRRILKENRTIAIVGLSAQWHRPSNFAAKYMIDHGYTVIPVNPQYEEVLGQKCYKSLRDIPGKVDMVDCFRKSEDIPPLVDDAIAIRRESAVDATGRRQRSRRGKSPRRRT